MSKVLTYKEFQEKFLATEDFDKLSELLRPLMTNFIYKSKRYDSWNKIFKKCGKILKSIYKNNFKNGFQKKHFLIEEKDLLVNIFKLFQRIQMFSNNHINLPNTHLYLSYALSFDFQVSLQAFKAMSLFSYKERLLKNNHTQIEVLLKLINLPDVKIKKSLYDDLYIVNETLSTPLSDPLEYFNINKVDKNITDLYLEAHKILCSKEMSFIIKIYSLITIGSLVEESENILRDIKNYIKINIDDNINDEMKYLLDEYVFHLLQTDFDKEVIKEILEFDDFIKKRLIYKETSSFENINIFSNITLISFNVKYCLLSKVNNPDLDFQYFSGLYNIIARESDIFDKVLDLEDFKILLTSFDSIHLEKDRLALKMLFKIINETYKKSSAFFEPFEDSKYLQKCIFLIKSQSKVFSQLCCSTISFFINNDPLSILAIEKHGVLEIFNFYIENDVMNFTILDLLDDLSLNHDLRKKIINEKIINKFLDKILSQENFNLEKFTNKFNKFLKHHPEYKEKILEYIKLHIENKSLIKGYLEFVDLIKFNELNLDLQKNDLVFENLDFLVNNNFNLDKKWKVKFLNLLNNIKLKNNYLEKIINSFLIQEIDNFLIIEIYLNIICNSILQIKEEYNDLKLNNYKNIFYRLFEILDLITDQLKDKLILDFFSVKDKDTKDLNFLIWIEINYILDFIWYEEEKNLNNECLKYFLNLFVNKQIKKHKIFKFNFSINEKKRDFMISILLYNISNWEKHFVTQFIEWLFINFEYFTITEICDMLSSITWFDLPLKNEYFNWITKFLLDNNFNNKILTFYDSLLFFNDMQINKDIVKVYKKYLTPAFDLQYKNILEDFDVSKIFINNFQYKIYYDKPEICYKIINEHFFDNEDFIRLCIHAYKYYTFNIINTMNDDIVNINTMNNDINNMNTDIDNIHTNIDNTNNNINIDKNIFEEIILGKVMKSKNCN